MKLRRTYVTNPSGAEAGAAPAAGGGGVYGGGAGVTVPAVHGLVSDRHTVSGLTAGQVLKALGSATFGFAALLWSEISSIPAVIAALAALADATGWLHNNGSHGLSWSTPTAANVGAEPVLGNPGADGSVLASTMAGVRSWIAPGGSGSSPLQRLTIASVATALLDGTGFRASPDLTVAAGHSLRIRWAANRSSIAANLGLVISADGGATGYLLIFDTATHAIHYAYYGAAYHSISVTSFYSILGAHAVDLLLTTNATATGFGLSVSIQTRTGVIPMTAVTSYTALTLYGTLSLWLVAPAAADCIALDVEVM